MTNEALPWPIAAMPLASDSDVAVARQRTRRVAEAMGFDAHDQVRIATAVSEIARNAVSHARDGRIEFAFDGGGAGQALVVTVSDHGPGIPDPDRIWAGGSGSGLGMIAARRLMDTFDVDGLGGAGTRIRMRKALPRRAATLARPALDAIALTLAREAPRDAYAELREQSRDLMRAIEEQRRQQEELRALNRELEETNRGVLALYAELEDKAVAVRQASEAKSRFLSNVSHELRTPIQSMLAIGRLLIDRVDGDLAPEQERQVRFIHESARTLAGLVDDLLDLAKVEAGRMDLRLSRFEVNSLLGALRGLLKPLHVNPAVNVVFEDSPPLPLFSDEGKIAQILRNLVSNALKFTTSGEVRVVTCHDAATDRVAFSVRDTGIGIAPQDRERIFEEFEQVPNALQRQSKGTGLGLPLARHLAHLLGGTVTVASEVGRGSTFTLRLPRRFSTLTRPPGPGDETAIRLDGAQRALVIDDDDGWRYLVAQAVRARGLEVHETADVRAALQHARDAAPDIIFLDLAMPGLDGYQALDAVKSDPATWDIPVVIVSGSAPDRGEQQALSLALTILPKSSQLRDVVDSLFGGSARYG
jgi:signal transduction histidine kinase/CheY-like chemotaxis protein